MPLTDEDLAQVTEHLTPVLTKLVTDTTGKVVNDGITKRFATFEKSFGETIKTSLGSIATDIDARLDEKIAGMKPPAKTGAAGDQVPDPIVVGLKKQIDLLTKQNETTAAERKAERDKARKTGLAAKAQETFLANGGDPARVAHALGYLRAEDRIGYAADDSDDLVFKEADGSTMDLATGLASWLKSPDGLHYVPPKGAGGSGATGNRPPPRKPAGTEKPNLREALGNMALSGLMNLGPGVRPGQ